MSGGGTVPIGMGVTFGAYVLGILGYCWLRGYNVTFMNLWGLTWPAKSAAAATPAAAPPGSATV
jgi:hypothetical protein